MTLKAYMVFDRNAGPKEGASLAFARTAREAKALGWRGSPVFEDAGWTDVAVLWLRREAQWLAEQEGVALYGEPRLIEAPKACQRCELWGNGPLDADGICEGCRDDEEIEEAFA